MTNRSLTVIYAYYVSYYIVEYFPYRLAPSLRNRQRISINRKFSVYRDTDELVQTTKENIFK